jgi:hypothetical protein
LSLVRNYWICSSVNTESTTRRQSHCLASKVLTFLIYPATFPPSVFMSFPLPIFRHHLWLLCDLLASLLYGLFFFVFRHEYVNIVFMYHYLKRYNRKTLKCCIFVLTLFVYDYIFKQLCNTDVSITLLGL